MKPGQKVIMDDDEFEQELNRYTALSEDEAILLMHQEMPTNELGDPIYDEDDYL